MIQAEKTDKAQRYPMQQTSIERIHQRIFFEHDLFSKIIVKYCGFFLEQRMPQTHKNFETLTQIIRC